VTRSGSDLEARKEALVASTATPTRVAVDIEGGQPRISLQGPSTRNAIDAGAAAAPVTTGEVIDAYEPIVWSLTGRKAAPAAADDLEEAGR
jgi:hypothetical protein